MAKARRTTHPSTKGKKLYAVRDSEGKFKDIQTYERAHGMDLQRTSKAEVAAKSAKTKAKKKTKKKTTKKKARKKAAPRK
jgi:hypothetical protein